MTQTRPTLRGRARQVNAAHKCIETPKGGDSMLAYSTVAHNTGVHVIRLQGFCSPSPTNLAPPSGQRFQSDRKLYVFHPCSSLSAAAAPSPNVSPQCTFLIYRLLGLSPLASFAVNMISCFDLSLAVVAHKVLSRNATLMLVKHRFIRIFRHCRECTGRRSIGAEFFLFVLFCCFSLTTAGSKSVKLAAKL